MHITELISNQLARAPLSRAWTPCDDDGEDDDEGCRQSGSFHVDKTSYWVKWPSNLYDSNLNENGQKSSEDKERPMIQMVERAIVQDATDATAVEMPQSASTLFERLSSCLHLPRDDSVTTFSSQSHNWAV